MPFPGSRSTVDVRLGLHRASLASLAERPVSGHGLGSYAVTALEHRDLTEAQLEPGAKRGQAFEARAVEGLGIGARARRVGCAGG